MWGHSEFCSAISLCLIDPILSFCFVQKLSFMTKLGGRNLKMPNAKPYHNYNNWRRWTQWERKLWRMHHHYFFSYIIITSLLTTMKEWILGIIQMLVVFIWFDMFPSVKYKAFIIKLYFEILWSSSTINSQSMNIHWIHY